jgi:hypothetical protein
MTTTVPAYLHALDSALVGPRRVKRGLLAEAADHLAEGQQAYERAGYDAPEAASRAIAEFGSVEEVAPAFQTTLAVAASRRTAWALLAFLLPQPLLWDGGLRLAGEAQADNAGSANFVLVDTVLESVGSVAMLGAFLTVLATGVGNRWFQAGRQIARGTAWFTIGACAAVPLLAGSLAVMSGELKHPGHLLLMLVFVLLPVALVSLTARRCLTASQA